MLDLNSHDYRRKHRLTDFVDRDMELDFIAGVVKERQIIEKVHLSFDSNVISSDLIKWIYDKAIWFYLEENVLMDDSAFKNALDVDARKKKTLLSLWKKIKKRTKATTMAGTVAAMKKLKTLYDGRVLSLCVNELIKDLSKAKQGGDFKAIEKARENLSAFNDCTIKKDFSITVGDPRDDYEDWKKKYIKVQKNPGLLNGIPTGIPQIDKQLLGLRDGEFGLIAGPTGSGKSVMLMNLATYCWKLFGDIVIVTIEMPKEQYEMRWYCYMSGIDYEMFRKLELSKEHWNHLDKTIEKAKKNEYKFHILDMPEGCTTRTIQSEIKPFIQRGKVKQVDVDYINIIGDAKGETDFSWQTQLKIATEMKLKIARGFNIPTWTVSQVDGNDGTAFSKHIKDQLDVGMYINVTPETNETGIVNISWIKTRDFRGVSFDLETTLNKMRFRPSTAEEKHSYKVFKKKKRGMKV